MLHIQSFKLNFHSPLLCALVYRPSKSYLRLLATLIGTRPGGYIVWVQEFLLKWLASVFIKNITAPILQYDTMQNDLLSGLLPVSVSIC